MKFLSFILLLGWVTVGRADTAGDHDREIPGVSSLQVAGNDSVTLSSEHRHLRHMLANGGEYVHTAVINAETGEIIKTPEKGLRLTIKVGESYFWEGEVGFAGYKLLGIRDGLCVFEYWGYHRNRRKFEEFITISPYPKN